MIEHSELVKEMALLDTWTAQERLKFAKQRRQEQIQHWKRQQLNLVNELEIERRPKKKQYHVQFPQRLILLEATARQDFDEVLRLLQNEHLDPNMSNDDGLTPIHQCAIDDSEELLRLLIEFGGEVNARDRDRWTPLHAAATCGHVEICKILIENGADLLAMNADGNMPYDICDEETTLDFIETAMDRVGITQEMIDQMRLLGEQQMLTDLQSLVELKSLALSATESIQTILSFTNEDGATPLHIASANGYQTVVEFLLYHRVPLELRDADGWTPMHCAAFWCQTNVLKSLIEAGADIYIKLSDGRSALELCDDPDLRVSMISLREEFIKSQQSQSKRANSDRPRLGNSFSFPSSSQTRHGNHYESRSSVSSPYGSGSSLNRTNSMRRTSLLHDRHKVKQLNESFLEVLEAQQKIAADELNDDRTNVFLPVPVDESSVSPQEESSVLPNTAETLSERKRQRLARRHQLTVPSNNVLIAPPLSISDLSSYRNPSTTPAELLPTKIIPEQKKRICCRIS